MTVSPSNDQVNAGALTKPDIDMAALRSYRLRRLCEQMNNAGVDLAVLTNPVTLRYVADWREYLLYQSHIPTYTLFVTPDGAMTMFGAYGGHSETIGDLRPTHGLNGFDGGLDQHRCVENFVADVIEQAGPGAKVALEPLNPSAPLALVDAGLDVVDAEPLVEQAKLVKSTEEIRCIAHSVAVAEHALALMRSEPPGRTENELFAILHQVNIANDGDWIDGRMLCSGPRTNPWYQTATDRVVEPGDFVAVDTDMVGPFGYTADISRTWVRGEVEPTPAQKDCYRRALEEIQHNATLLAPGVTFSELSQKAFRQPDEFVAHRYTCLAHGVGMADEYPRIFYPQDFAVSGYDGVLPEGSVLTVESFVGSAHGGPGVKLEDMYHITAGGAQRLSSFPYETNLTS